MMRWLLAGLAMLLLLALAVLLFVVVRRPVLSGEVSADPLPTLAVSEAIPILPTATQRLVSLPPTFTPLPPLVEAVTLTATPTPTASPTLPPTPTDTAEPSPLPTETVVPAVLLPTPDLPLTPGNPQPYLQHYRLVSFYGVTSGPELGILGTAPREVMLQQLQALAAEYQALANDRIVLPTFHIIVTVADPFPGPTGRYSHWTSEAQLAEWVAFAAERGVAVVLDVQPGRADLVGEVERLRPYLLQPHVHLAIDPEFTMAEGEVPGRVIGQVDGAQINSVQAVLQEIALEVGLNKVLIVHQFDPTMVVDKAAIQDYANVELVMDADGFGSPTAKSEDYLAYADEPGFEYGGFKLFYEWDMPLMDPAGVLALRPVPAVIIYQ